MLAQPACPTFLRLIGRDAEKAAPIRIDPHRGRRRGGEGSHMTTATWVTMVLVMGFIWGGFALALLTAVRKESGKRADG